MRAQEAMMTLSLALALGMMTLVGAVAVQAAGGGDAQSTETPFFCNLKALTTDERAEHRDVTRRVLESVQNTKELADGYAFTVDSARVSIKDLATFVDFERRCCPFFDFRLD